MPSPAVDRLSRFVYHLLVFTVIALALYPVRSIVGYVFAGALLSMLLRPVCEFFRSRRLAGRRIPQFLAPALSLLMVFLGILLIISLFIPVAIEQTEALEDIQPEKVAQKVKNTVDEYQFKLTRYGIDIETSQKTVKTLQEQILGFLGVSSVTGFLAGIVRGLGKVGVAAFVMGMISFFLLYNRRILPMVLLAITPYRYNRRAIKAYYIAEVVLRRYIRGLLVLMLTLGSLIFLGSWSLGLPGPLTLGLVGGFTMVIPYLGPYLSFGLNSAILVGTSLQSDTPVGLAWLKLTGIYFAIQILDMTLLEPIVYGDSLDAHPLEITLILVSAGAIGGLGAMLAALPVYVVIRSAVKVLFHDHPMIARLPGNYNSFLHQQLANLRKWEA